MAEQQQSRKPRILIVGGSIAGLTAATALKQTGLVEVHVYERSSALGSDRRPRNGGGVGLHDTSNKTLKLLGITNLVSLRMQMQEDRDRTGRIIRHGEIPFSSAYWGDVQRSLYEAALSAGTIFHYGKEVIRVEESADEVTLFFGDESTVSGDCVVGADGILSIVRSFMLAPEPDLVRHSGYSLWRGLVDPNHLPDEIKTELKSVSPEGTLSFELSEKCHALFYHLDQGLNWGIYLNASQGAIPDYQHREEVVGKITKEPTLEEIQAFHETVKSLFRPIVVSIVEATEGAFPNQIYDRDVLPSYHTSRCVLIGDAAHSSTPHYARGTHMAIQDGYALGQAVATALTISAPKLTCETLQVAFRLFEKDRLEYSNHVVLTARRIGRIKQGVFSSKQGLQWDLNCTTPELIELLNDKIVDKRV